MFNVPRQIGFQSGTMGSSPFTSRQSRQHESRQAYPDCPHPPIIIEKVRGVPSKSKDNPLIRQKDNKDRMLSKSKEKSLVTQKERVVSNQKERVVSNQKERVVNKNKVPRQKINLKNDSASQPKREEKVHKTGTFRTQDKNT